MKTDKLTYKLPPELIAQRPADSRSASRLLVMDRSSGQLTDSEFNRLGQYLRKGDCLVINDTKVIPARFFARRKTGAKLEGLFLESAAGQNRQWLVMLKGVRKLKPNEQFILLDRTGSEFCQAQLISRHPPKADCTIEVHSNLDAETILENCGLPPLPPYIRRDWARADSQADADSLRYQTVYARQTGAVAAPTAGLHFTKQLINQLKAAGVEFANITLHVGAGTFKPVSAEKLEDHQIHSERFSVDAAAAEKINRCKENGHRLIAVGTTSVRTLETIAENPTSARLRPISPASGTTQLFITPGYQFKIVDAMITNFHLPRSTLLALVASFAGLDKTLAAYRHAIQQKYRFYSYGDAMMIT